jgi:hypothetical protein
MSKNKKKKVSQSKTNTQPATLAQVASIEQLKQRIERKAADINRLPSMAISSLVFPPLFMLMLLSKQSPLHAFYQRHYDNLYRLRHAKTQQAFSPAHDLMSAIMTGLNALDDALLKLVNVVTPALELSGHHGRVDKLAVIKFIESAKNTNTEYKDFHAGFVKKYALLLSKVSRRVRSIPKDRGVINTNLTKLYLSVQNKLVPALAQYQQEQMPNLEKGISAHLTRLEVTNWMLWPKVIIMVLGQKFVMDKLFKYYFPTSVVHYNLLPPVLPANLQSLNQAQANNAKTQLIRIEKKLGTSASIANYLSVGSIPVILGLYFTFFQEAEVSPYIYFYLISILANLLTNSAHVVRKSWQHLRYQHDVNISNKNCDRLFNPYTNKQTFYDNGHMADNQYELRFKREIPLSSKQVTRNIVNVLMKHGIKPIQLREESITLSAPDLYALSEKKRLLIDQDIKAALNRNKETVALLGQLTKLKGFLDVSLRWTPKLDNGYLYFLKININVPETLKDAVILDFSDARTKWIKKENGVLSLKRHNPIDPDKLSHLLAACKAYNKDEYDKVRAQIPSSHPPPSFSTTILSIKRVKQKTTEPKKRPTIEKIEKKHVFIKWPSAVYDSNKQNNTVHPIINFHGKHQQYTLFKLTPTDFSGDQGAHDHYKKIITESPKFVPPKGRQGIVNASEYVKNAQNHLFFAVKKAKTPSGPYGNMRVYAHAEKSVDGDTLYVFDSLKPTGTGH